MVAEIWYTGDVRPQKFDSSTFDCCRIFLKSSLQFFESYRFVYNMTYTNDIEKVIFQAPYTFACGGYKNAPKRVKNFPTDRGFFPVYINTIMDPCAKFQPHYIYFRVRGAFFS